MASGRFGEPLFDIVVDATTAEDLARSGRPLPELGEFEDRIDLGLAAYDEDGQWQLRFRELAHDEHGEPVLTLEIDGYMSVIAAFGVRPDRPLGSAELSTAEPMWRAVGALAVDEIRRRALAHELGELADDVEFQAFLRPDEGGPS